MLGNRPSTATVLGAGPAGLALALELKLRGVEVRVLAPEPERPWAASYGTFEAFLPSAYRFAVRERYADPSWIDRDGVRRATRAPYVRLDTAGLQQGLLNSLRGLGVEMRSSQGETVDSFPGQLVFDATGAAATGEGRLYQSAYGLKLRAGAENWLAPGEMVFMDVRGAADSKPPSFLYAMREGEHYFVQETVLVASRPVPFAILESRLRQRLAGHGLAGLAVEGEERCLIPMSGARELGQGNWVTFGARSGLTQPASGYQLARTLGLAASTASLVADGSTRSGSTVEQVARAVRAHLWPRERRVTWALYDFGARRVAEMDQAALAVFLESFLRAPSEDWTAFVDGRLGLSRVLGLMSQVFARSDFATRSRLLGLATTSRHSASRSALSANAPPSLRALPLLETRKELP